MEWESRGIIPHEKATSASICLHIMIKHVLICISNVNYHIFQYISPTLLWRRPRNKIAWALGGARLAQQRRAADAPISSEPNQVPRDFPRKIQPHTADLSKCKFKNR